jgi:hypothetical protein
MVGIHYNTHNIYTITHLSVYVLWLYTRCIIIIVIIIVVHPMTSPQTCQDDIILHPARWIGRKGGKEREREREREGEFHTRRLIYFIFHSTFSDSKCALHDVPIMCAYIITICVQSHACSTNVTPGSSQRSKQDSMAYLYDILHATSGSKYI